jgi:hypothetical protein
MKWIVSLSVVYILAVGVFGQTTIKPSSARPPQTRESGVLTNSRSRFEFGAFVITKTGLLKIKGQTNEFLLLPEIRYPGELRSVFLLDLQDQIYLARFGEPGGIGVDGFYDICFQIKAGKVLTHGFELGGSLERVSDKMFMRSSSYLYDRASKTVLKLKYGDPATPTTIAVTNVLSPFVTKE